MSLPENIDQEKLAEVALVILYLGPKDTVLFEPGKEWTGT